MLQVKNLNIHHKKDLRPLAADLSFTLNAGDRAAIIGEEGNGKSTLLKLLYDPALVEDYTEYDGAIIKNHLICGYLPQELAGADYRELASLAGKLGLDAGMLYSDARMGLLSGGEKIKVQLIRILSKRPNLFLLDEPSNDIDIDTLEWLEDFISGCTFPVLYISHDETLLEHTANMILHMEQLKRKTESHCTVFRTGYREYVKTGRRDMSGRSGWPRKRKPPMISSRKSTAESMKR